MKDDFERGWQLGYNQGLRDEMMLLESLHTLSAIKLILPDLEENKSTKSVARKLRAILGEL